MDKNDQLTQFVIDIITKCDGTQLDVGMFDESDQELVEALNKLSRYNYEARDFANEIAEGNLESETPQRDNAVTWPLRALRSSLSHLTWQSKRVAEGDYNQHVDFLGEFSDAFNMMINQLSLREKSFQLTNEHQSEKLKEMESIAYKDVATGCYNRRYCLERIDSLLKSHEQFSLAFVDLNNLKEINDQFGHDAGDEYILSAIDSLKEVLRVDDAVCRFGGDEIIILLSKCSESVGLSRMKEAQEKIVLVGQEHGWKLSISYGVVEVNPKSTYETTELIKEADRRMYEFKQTYKRDHHLAFH